MGVPLTPPGCVAQKVADVMKIEAAEIWKEGKKTITVQARSLLCYWATKELGMTAEAVSKQVRLSESGVISRSSARRAPGRS